MADDIPLSSFPPKLQPQVPLGTIAKAGQTVDPTDIYGQMQAMPGQAASALGNVLGVNDAMKALRGEQTPDEAQMFALGALPALIGGPEAKAAEEAVPLASKAIRAFHGSPYDFNAFDMSKIGTGEGAQAYGHGLYLAENPATAQQYKDALGHKGIEWATPDAASKYDPFTLEALKREFQKGQTKDDIMKMNAQYAREADSSGQPNLMGDMHNALASGDVSAGKMYEVNINADPDHFLDWDKPLSEQPPIVQDLARNADLSHLDPGNRTRRQIEMWREGTLPNKESEPTGNVLHSALTDYGTNTQNNAALTDQLRDAGIPGIKYLDQGSRSSGQGTSNYVVFNDKLIDIIKKYGLAGMLGGGAGGAAMTQQRPPLSSLQQ